MCKYCEGTFLWTNGHIWNEEPSIGEMSCYVWRNKYGEFRDPKKPMKILSKPKKWKFCPMCGKEIKNEVSNKHD